MCGRIRRSLSWMKSGEPLRVSGVPPDYFSATGQRWGNPLYKWALLQEHGFRLVGGADPAFAGAL